MQICLSNKYLFKLLADYFKMDYPTEFTDCSVFLNTKDTILTCSDIYGGVYGIKIDYRCTSLFIDSHLSSLYLDNQKYSLAVFFSSNKAEFII